MLDSAISRFISDSTMAKSSSCCPVCPKDVTEETVNTKAKACFLIIDVRLLSLDFSRIVANNNGTTHEARALLLDSVSGPKVTRVYLDISPPGDI